MLINGANGIQRMEELFKSLLEAAPDAMVIANAAGNIELVNAQAERMFGYERSELVGQAVEILLPAALAQRHTRHRAGYVHAPRARMMGQGLVLEGRRKGGGVFPVEIALSPLETDGGLLVIAAVRDVTERKRSEEAERLLLAIMRSSNDAIISCDLEGRVTSWNPGAETVFGYAASEIIGLPIALLFPKELADEEIAIDRRAITGGGHVEHYETVRLRKDGTTVAVSITVAPIHDEKGTITGASKFAHDISARKRAESEIRDLNRTLEQRVEERTRELFTSEKRYHDALDSLMEGVQIIGFDWRYIYINDAALEQSTYGRAVMLGHSIMELYPGVEDTPLFHDLRLCMEQRTPRSLETDFNFPNGKTATFQLSIQPVREGLLILSTDITQRKQYEAELLEQREQLQRQNTELEQFAYIASHDLQEPLRMVTSFMQLLQRRLGGKLGQEADEYIGYAVDGAQRMKQVINDLLIYSRLGRPVEFTEVDLAQVLDQVLFDLDLAVKDAGAQVEQHGLPRIRAGRTEMLQVFQNLVSNAIKFRRDGVPPLIIVRCEGEGDRWHFRVQDNGIGIDETYRQKVFVPFKRLHDRTKYPGTGIGLAVVHKIVQRYGGAIWCEPAPEQGTVFHFTLPITT
jgi:PAS domain S-box-containing protein